MKITDVEIYILRAPEPARAHWVSHFVVPTANDLLVRLRTEDGLQGFGLGSSNTSVEASAMLFSQGLTDELIGEDALAPERIYQKVFALTHSREAFERGYTKDALVLAGAALDIALWDLMGQAAGVPLYRLFGGMRNAVPCYVTCAYYRDGKTHQELRDEMQMLKGQGHRAFKAKVGGLSLKEDLERLAIIREEIGDDAELMIDVNRGWTLETALEAAREMVPLKPRWLEEPVRWMDDARELRLLSAKTSIPLSAGESEQTGYGCRDLVEQGAIEILQFDCTRMGGFTMGRKLSALAELYHVQLAPHHDCFLHAHLVAASPAGLIVESFTDPERDPLQAELFEQPPQISDGLLTLNEAPGLGLTLSEAALRRYGTKVT